MKEAALSPSCAIAAPVSHSRVKAVGNLPEICRILTERVFTPNRARGHNPLGT